MISFFTNPPYFGTSSKLCHACSHGNIELVKSLATVETANVKGWMGWAPLHKACQGGHAEIVSFLLSNKELNVDINILDSELHTPLHLACGISLDNFNEGFYKTAQILIDNGALIDAEDEGGYTPLDLACINNNVQVAKLLIEHGANVSHANLDGFTPLHVACTYQFQELADLLVSSGADFTIEDSHGRTPIVLAQRHNLKLNLNDSRKEVLHNSSSIGSPKQDSTEKKIESTPVQQSTIQKEILPENNPTENEVPTDEKEEVPLDLESGVE